MEGQWPFEDRVMAWPRLGQGKVNTYIGVEGKQPWFRPREITLMEREREEINIHE